MSRAARIRGWSVPRRLAAAALILILIAAGTIGVLYARSPAGALDVVDALLPGGGAVSRVAQGVPFASGNRLDVWAAPAPPGARRPVLIFFYGGSWVSGRRQDYGFVGRAYARQGFVVVIPDYRKVPAVRFPAFVEDGAAATGWVTRNIARYGGDPHRILLAGHSAGGYIAAMLALDRHYLAAEKVDPGVVKGVAGLAGAYDFYPFTWPEARAAMAGWPDPRDTQPITHARRDAPPLWLATGTADGTVRPDNARSLAAREKALGSRATVLRQYPGLDHVGIVMALSRLFRTKAPVLAESTAFFRRSLGVPSVGPGA